MQAIKSLSNQNIKQVFDISQEQFKNESWTLEQFEDALKFSNYVTYVLCEKNIVKAFLIAQDLVDSVNLLLVATKNEYKRNGLANFLINQLILDEKSGQNRKIWLEVKEHNTPAINLYLKNKFEQIAIRKKYYPDGQNAIILEYNF